jgi:hypothetical protein
VRIEADLIRCARLSLQLFLQLVEEAPVGALGDDFLGGALDHPHLMKAQGIEAHGVFGVILAPLIIGDLGVPLSSEQKRTLSRKRLDMLD